MQVITSGKLHFFQHGGCPGAAATCEMRSYLLAGNDVAVTLVQGEWAYAAFTGGAPRFQSTEGWLPRDDLRRVPVERATRAGWYGNWHRGDQQEIDIKPARGDLVEVNGLATWGGDNPARRANGNVNLGAFDTTLPMPGAMVVFSPSLNGGPAVLNPRDPSDCVIHLQLLGRYLVAKDNMNCGGANVTFDGVYRRAHRR